MRYTSNLVVLVSIALGGCAAVESSLYRLGGYDQHRFVAELRNDCSRPVDVGVQEPTGTVTWVGSIEPGASRKYEGYFGLLIRDPGRSDDPTTAEHHENEIGVELSGGQAHSLTVASSCFDIRRVGRTKPLASAPR